MVRLDSRGLSVGKRWKLRRNLAIYHLHKGGWSTRQLAEVFDLARSRVGEVIEDMRALEAQRGRAEDDRASDVANLLARCLSTESGSGEVTG